MEIKATSAPTGANPDATFTDTVALDMLASEANAPTPGAATSATVPKPTAADYMSEAGMLIGMGLQILAVKLGVVLDAEAKEEGAKKLAAVLAKHNGVMPDWYKRYEEEFALGIWCAGIAWKSYEMYRQKKSAPVAPSDDGGGNAQT